MTVVNWQGVKLFTESWAAGTRADQYFGTVTVQSWLADAEILDREQEWEKAEMELLEALKDKAAALGANAVVGLEVHADPWAAPEGQMGLGLWAVGIAAHLVDA